MLPTSRAGLSLSVAISIAVACQAGDNGLQATFDAEGVTVHDGERLVLTYQRAVKSLDAGWPRANYVHPLYDLNGNVVTEDFPDDHGHHRGVFWAWHQVWLGDKRLGDPWICKDFVWDVRSVEVASPASPMTVSADVEWKSPAHVDSSGNLIPVVQEKTEITIHAANDSYRAIDFRISLQALLEGVRIGGSEDDKGYGGFSPRIKLSDDQRFLSDSGEVEPTKTALEAGPWINLVGKQSGLVMIVHESNPKSSKSWPWILRGKRSMQNAVYPGRDPVTLPTDRSIVLRYRLVIHDGTLSDTTIDSIQKNFWRSN
jgi:hypothetical protein